MTVQFQGNLIIISFKGHVLVKANGTRRDVRRLMEIAQENLNEVQG